MTSIFSASSAVRAKRSMASFAASWASTHRRAKGAKARPASERCTFLPDRSNRSTPNSFSSACTALLSPCCEIYSLRAAKENEPNWAISRKYLRDSMRMRPPAFRPTRPVVIIANPGPFRRARTCPSCGSRRRQGGMPRRSSPTRAARGTGASVAGTRRLPTGGCGVRTLFCWTARSARRSMEEAVRRALCVVRRPPRQRSRGSRGKGGSRSARTSFL